MRQRLQRHRARPGQRVPWHAGTWNGELIGGFNQTLTLQSSVTIHAPTGPPLPSTPSIATTASPTSGVAGTASTNVGDSATLTGVSTTSPPTGETVTFALYSDCHLHDGGGPACRARGRSRRLTPGTSVASWSAATWTPPGVWHVLLEGHLRR